MIKIGNSTNHISTYTCQSKSKIELKEIIKDRINKEGPDCDLNDIDTSLITDMSTLFFDSKFTGDISKWNVSNVRDMSFMFYNSEFNSDISKWDMLNVKDMFGMFYKAKFNQDIANWNIRKDCITYEMFDCCHIEEENKPKKLQQQ